MNILSFPELFYEISTSLNDKEKIFLTSCSKKTYDLKSLIKLNSEYDLLEINASWYMCIKNIVIEELTLESKKLIENAIPESIVVNSELEYVKFISNDINVKLLYDEEKIEKIIKKLVFFECPYVAMKMMLDDESINNINEQFIKTVKYGYLSVMKLLIELGADIKVRNNEALIQASNRGHLSIVQLLIKLGANINDQDNEAIICASNRGHLFVAKLLIDSGSDIGARNNLPIILASANGHLSIVKLLIDSGAYICARDNSALINASWGGHLSVVKLLIDSGADVHAQNNKALEYAKEQNHSDIIELLKN